MKVPHSRRLAAICALSLISLCTVFLAEGCTSGLAPAAPTESDATPPADSIGEALFLDTRFGQFFAANMTGVNSPLLAGDPVVTQTQTLNGPLPGPFAGQAINCRTCHFVTEFEGVPNAGNRTYSDFTTRSRSLAHRQMALTIRHATRCRWWTRLRRARGRCFFILTESLRQQRTWWRGH